MKSNDFVSHVSSVVNSFQPSKVPSYQNIISETLEPSATKYSLILIENNTDKLYPKECISLFICNTSKCNNLFNLNFNDFYIFF